MSLQSDGGAARQNAIDCVRIDRLIRTSAASFSKSQCFVVIGITSEYQGRGAAMHNDNVVGIEQELPGSAPLRTEVSAASEYEGFFPGDFGKTTITGK